MSDTQFFPIYLQPTALSEGSDSNSPFCAQPPTRQLCWVAQLSNLPAQMDSVGMNWDFNLVSLLAGQLSLWGSLSSHTSAPLLKSKWGTHTALTSYCLVVYSTFPESKKSVSVKADPSLPVPLTVLGDRISLWNSPSWHCIYGCAALCVCAAWDSQLCIWS